MSGAKVCIVPCTHFENRAGKKTLPTMAGARFFICASRFQRLQRKPTHRTNVSARDTQAFFDPNQGSYETRTQTKNKEHILDGSDHEEPAHRISHLESGKAPAKASGTSYFHSRTGAGQPIMTIRTGITAAFQQTRL